MMNTTAVPTAVELDSMFPELNGFGQLSEDDMRAVDGGVAWFVVAGVVAGVIVVGFAAGAVMGYFANRK